MEHPGTASTLSVFAGCAFAIRSAHLKRRRPVACTHSSKAHLVANRTGRISTSLNLPVAQCCDSLQCHTALPSILSVASPLMDVVPSWVAPSTVAPSASRLGIHPQRRRILALSPSAMSSHATCHVLRTSVAQRLSSSRFPTVTSSVLHAASALSVLDTVTLLSSSLACALAHSAVCARLPFTVLLGCAVSAYAPRAALTLHTSHHR